MNDLQSRWDIHVELEDLKAEAERLAASIKKNFEGEYEYSCQDSSK